MSEETSRIAAANGVWNRCAVSPDERYLYVGCSARHFSLPVCAADSDGIESLKVKEVRTQYRISKTDSR